MLLFLHPGFPLLLSHLGGIFPLYLRKQVEFILDEERVLELKDLLGLGANFVEIVHIYLADERGVLIVLEILGQNLVGEFV